MRRALLDEQLPRALARELGASVECVQDRGWAGLTNGELLRAAVHAGFEVFITMDRNLRFQQNLQQYALGIILVRAATNRLSDLRPLVADIAMSITTVAPGQVVHIGA